MINNLSVIECLKNRVGFKQPDDPSMKRIYSDLTVSESGMYFQNIHPLVNLENLKHIAPQFDKYVHPPYSGTTTYKATERVSSLGKVYESLANSNTGNAVIDTTKWKEIDLFSEWLEEIRNEASVKVIIKALTEKKLRGELKSVIEDRILFEGNGRATDTVVKQGRFVFWEFKNKTSSNLSLVIQSVWTQLTAANLTPLNIYVYHSSKLEPVYIKTVPADKRFDFAKTAMTDLVLDEYGGSYFIGYYEDDLDFGVQAIKRYDYEFNKICDSGCSGYNNVTRRLWNNHLLVSPGYVSSANINEDKTIFDTSKVVYTYDNNYGLNFGLTVNCSLSKFICNNKQLFDNAIALQVGVDVLEQVANSVRNNAISEQTKSKAYYALNGKENPDALPWKLDKSIKAMDFDMSGLGECLPCKESKGVRFIAI